MPERPADCLHHQVQLHLDRGLGVWGLGFGVDGRRGPRWERYHESRRCSRDTCPDSCTTKYTSKKIRHRFEESSRLPPPSGSASPWCRVWGSGFGVRSLGLGFRAQVSGLGFRVYGFGFRFSGLGFGVSGLGLRLRLEGLLGLQVCGCTIRV